MFNEQTVTENGIIDRLKGLSGVKWTYCHGESLPKKAQDIFVDEWLKDALCSLNPDIAKQPDYADEVIYKLRGVVLEARHTGLVKANENFHEWLMAEKTLPFGENGDHITINLIDFDNIDNNHFVVSQQVDRKSTRLNSSHVRISYAVFCLKKKREIEGGYAEEGAGTDC